jgi:hypothetical protein
MPETDLYPSDLGPLRAELDTAIDSVMRALGYPARSFRQGGAWFVTGHRDQDPGAGR